MKKFSLISTSSYKHEFYSALHQFAYKIKNTDTHLIIPLYIVSYRMGALHNWC
jgi:hypothetical protein